MKFGLLAKILVICALAGAALLAGMMFSAQKQQVITSPPESSVALERLMALKLPDLEGRETSIAAWQGKILVINFWASWCGPCKEEMPAFSRVQESRGGQNVQFVGIAVDSADNVRAFVKEYPVSYPILLGGHTLLERSKELGNKYMGLPYTLVLDSKGRIQARKLGGIKEEELLRLLDDLEGKNNKNGPSN